VRITSSDEPLVYVGRTDKLYCDGK